MLPIKPALLPGHQEAEDQAAHERPDDPHEDVTDNAVAAALHDLPGQEARDETHDDPGNDATRL